MILPTYKSNNTCTLFQYSNNNNILDISKLDELLQNLIHNFNISSILIVGGEISLLSNFYFSLLFNLLKGYTKNIQVFTNFLNINKSIINECEILNILINFNSNNNTILENIKAYTSFGNNIVNVKCFDKDCEYNEERVIFKLNQLNVKSFEIIPSYTQKQPNNYFENIVKKYLKLSNKMKFAFQNELQLKNILNLDNYNTQIVYITPNNKYALQEEKDNKIILTEIDDYDELKQKLKEKEKFLDIFCKKCTSKLQCMKNYFSNYNENNNSCCGFKCLIDDYKKREIK